MGWPASSTSTAGTPHDVAAGPACVHLLDGVTDAAGDPVFVIVMPGRRAFSERSGEQRHGIVAAFTVPCVGDTLFRLQQIDVALVPRGPV